MCCWFAVRVLTFSALFLRPWRMPGTSDLLLQPSHHQCALLGYQDNEWNLHRYYAANAPVYQVDILDTNTMTFHGGVSLCSQATLSSHHALLKRPCIYGVVHHLTYMHGFACFCTGRQYSSNSFGCSPVAVQSVCMPLQQPSHLCRSIRHCAASVPRRFYPHGFWRHMDRWHQPSGARLSLPVNLDLMAPAAIL